MFDGVDVVTVATARAGRDLALYRDLLGFDVLHSGELPESARGAWGLPGAGPVPATLLGRPGARGGALRLLDVPEVPAPVRPRSIGDVGPHALDLYVRDLDATGRTLAGHGWRFRSPAQHYTLPGTDVPVHERLLEAPAGLLHAFVEYLPGRHRCALGTPEGAAAAVSEVVAVVLVVDDYPAARAFATDVLGATTYFTGRFGGPGVTTMMGLPPGTDFEMALHRGPTSRNARLEFIERHPDVPAVGGPTPLVVLSCAVDDLAGTLARAAAREPGSVVDGPRTVDLGDGATRRATVRTRWGGLFDLTQRPL